MVAAALIVLGIAAIVVIVMVLLDSDSDGESFGFRSSEWDDDPKVGIFLFIAEDPIMGMIEQVNRSEPVEREVTRRKKGTLSAGTQGIGAGVEAGAETRELFNDANQRIEAKCLPLVQHLEGAGKVCSRPDSFLLDSSLVPTLQNRPAQFIKEFLDERYPDGLEGVGSSEIAESLASHTENRDFHLSDSEARKRLLEHLAWVDESEEGNFVLVSDAWVVAEDGDHIELSRPDFHIRREYFVGPGNDEYRHAMPEDVSISTRIRIEDLLDHGRDRLIGLDRNTRLTIFGEILGFDPDHNRFEIGALLVYTES